MYPIDLTQEFSNTMPRYQGIPAPSFQDIATLERDGYAMTDLHFLNHLGTHVDAPAHLVPGATLDELPLSRLVTRSEERRGG